MIKYLKNYFSIFILITISSLFFYFNYKNNHHDINNNKIEEFSKLYHITETLSVFDETFPNFKEVNLYLVNKQGKILVFFSSSNSNNILEKIFEEINIIGDVNNINNNCSIINFENIFNKERFICILFQSKFLIYIFEIAIEPDYGEEKYLKSNNHNYEEKLKNHIELIKNKLIEIKNDK